MSIETSSTVRGATMEMQNTMKLRHSWFLSSMCSALKRPRQCAEQFLELKICGSPQFRAIDPPNPARGFIQQNQNVRLATAACIGKCGNARFGTVACAKMYGSCVSPQFCASTVGYGVGGGGPYHVSCFYFFQEPLRHGLTQCFHV